MIIRSTVRSDGRSRTGIKTTMPKRTLIFLVFALAGGASILLYVVLWIAVPSDGGVQATPISHAGNETVAVVLISIGALWLLANIGAFSLIEWRFAWPLVLVALGVLLFTRRFVR